MSDINTDWLEVGIKVTWGYSGPNGKYFWRKGKVVKINPKTATVEMNRDNNRGVYPPKLMRVRKEALKQ